MDIETRKLVKTLGPERLKVLEISGNAWTGLRHLLAECAFPLERIKTGSCGNHSCVVAELRRWHRYHWWHSLRNDPRFPGVVWALAEKPANVGINKEN